MNVHTRAFLRSKIAVLVAVLVSVVFTACSGNGSLPQGPSNGSAPSQSLSVVHAPKYRLVILGDRELFPDKINDNGVIVGRELRPSNPTSWSVAFEYKNGQITDLPLLAGDTLSDAYDVNNHDQIVGQSLPTLVDAAHPIHAVLWQQGGVTDLGSVPHALGAPPNNDNAARAINAGGEIVGYSGPLPSGPNELPPSYVTIFSPGPPRAITVGGVVAQGAATGVNNAGEIVGIGDGPAGYVPFAYPDPITCSPSPTAGISGINDRGDTFWPGEFPLAALLCTHGIGLGLHMFADGMNAQGDVVGQNTEPPPPFYDGVLYSHGRYFVLNDLVSNAQNIDFLPTSINNAGEIVGFAFSIDTIAASTITQIEHWYRSARANPHRVPQIPPSNVQYFGFLLVPQ